MSTPLKLWGPRRAAAGAQIMTRIGLMLAALFWGRAAEPGEGGLTIGPVASRGDRLEFEFTSAQPRGVSYQPQFLRSVSGAWADLPDARVEEVEPGSNIFRVIAPQFGLSGFYRVVPSTSQPEDPLADTLRVPEPEEILLWWNQPSFGAANVLRGKVYYHVEASPGGPVGNQFEAYPGGDFGASSPVAESGAHDTLIADLNGDGRPDPVVAWINPLHQIVVGIAEIESTNLTWVSRLAVTLTNSATRADGSTPPQLRLAKAKVEGEPDGSLWLGYSGADGLVHVALLRVNETLTDVELVSEVATAELSYESGGSLRDRSAQFDLAAGDFDGDGWDEIAVVHAESYSVANGISNWRLVARFYDYLADSRRFIADTIPNAERILYAHDNRTTRWLSRIACLAADFDSDGRDELAVVHHVGFSSQSSPWFLNLLRPTPSFDRLAQSADGTQPIDSINGSNGYPLDLRAGEFDGDSLPELVIGSRKLQLFDVRADLTFSKLTEEGISPESNAADRRFLTLANLDSRDANIGFRPEVVVAFERRTGGGNEQRLTVASFQVTGDATTFYRMEENATLADEPSTAGTRFLAIAAADFGGNGAKLGTPRRYTRTISGKPVVIVNAPPVHFDVLNGQAIDVNDQFPVSECERDPDSGQLVCPFFSRYAAGTANSITVEARWQRSWDVSIKAEGGGTLPIKGIGVEAEVRTKFGEQLDSYTATAETTVVEIQVDAIGDDRVYATTIDYTIWEYPVLANGEVVGHVMVVSPEVARQNWFGSKSIVAQNYRPYHEVGNLLSYRATASPYPGADYVREIIGGDTFTVDSSSAFVWRLTRTSNTTTQESRTFNFSVEAQASFDIPIPFVPNLEVAGGYRSSALKSNTTDVSDEQGLTAFLGALDGSIAGTAYSITPYLYWDRSGAVVLDYAVDLPAGTPSVPTFWGQQYGVKPDPAFLLPWRWDQEKGLALPDPALRELTRDIMTLPPEPRPGEVVEINARVSNFSLLDTSTSLVAKFYLGDPRTGGQALTSTEGHSQALIPARIPARGKHLIRFPWRVPETLASASIKIYCVIDTDDQLAEIHEDNNIGWNEIFLRASP